MMWRRDLERAVREFAEEVSSLVESAVSPLKLTAYIGPDGYRRPVANAYVDGDSVIAVFEVPGASKEKVKLRVREMEVEVEAGFSDELLGQASRYPIFREAKGYRRTLTLPRRVEASKAKAVLKDGILIVKAPLRGPAGIEVKVE